MPMIISSKGPENVRQIHKQFICCNFFLSPEEFHKETVWNLPQKQLLIDTVFRVMYISKF